MNISPDLEGIIKADHLEYKDYVIVGGRFVKNWIWYRLAEIPDGSYVKISIEIMDVPHDQQ